MSVQTCSCGCGTTTTMESPAEATTCGCGCGSTVESHPKSREEEIAELRAVRESVVRRLAELEG
jgi:hypothetical protein